MHVLMRCFAFVLVTVGHVVTEAVATECPAGYFQCLTVDQECIPEKWWRDGQWDCSDGSDEGCPRWWFECNDGQCVYEPENPSARPSIYMNCVRECDDYSDEGGKEAFEESCRHRMPTGDSRRTVTTAAHICSETEFICRNGKCIDRSFYHDGIDDCDDRYDEQCSRWEYRCPSGHCINATVYLSVGCTEDKQGNTDTGEGSSAGTRPFLNTNTLAYAATTEKGSGGNVRPDNSRTDSPGSANASQSNKGDTGRQGGDAATKPRSGNGNEDESPGSRGSSQPGSATLSSKPDASDGNRDGQQHSDSNADRTGNDGTDRSDTTKEGNSTVTRAGDNGTSRPDRTGTGSRNGGSGATDQSPGSGDQPVVGGTATTGVGSSNLPGSDLDQKGSNNAGTGSGQSGSGVTGQPGSDKNKQSGSESKDQSANNSSEGTGSGGTGQSGSTSTGQPGTDSTGQQLGSNNSGQSGNGSTQLPGSDGIGQKASSNESQQVSRIPGNATATDASGTGTNTSGQGNDTTGQAGNGRTDVGSTNQPGSSGTDQVDKSATAQSGVGGGNQASKGPAANSTGQPNNTTSTQPGNIASTKTNNGGTGQQSNVATTIVGSHIPPAIECEGIDFDELPSHHAKSCKPGHPGGCGWGTGMVCQAVSPWKHECRCPAGHWLSKTSEKKCERSVLFRVQFRMLQLCNKDLEYVPNMDDPESEDFKNVQKLTMFGMTTLMDLTPTLQDKLLGGSVDRFLPGSIVVRGMVSFRTHTIQRQSRRRRQTSGSVTANDIQQQVTEALQQTGGLLGESRLSVDEGGIVVLAINPCTSSDFNDCHEDATCQYMSNSQYTCACHFGFIDTSPDRNYPGRNCSLAIATTRQIVSSTVGYQTSSANISGPVISTNSGITPKVEESLRFNCSGMILAGSCVSTGIGSTIIVILVLLILILLLLIIFLIYWYRKRRRNYPVQTIQQQDAWTEAEDDDYKRVTKSQQRILLQGRSSGSSGDSLIREEVLQNESPLPNSLVSPREVATSSKQIQAFSSIDLRSEMRDASDQTYAHPVMDSGDQTDAKQVRDSEDQTSQVRLVKESGDQTEGKPDVVETKDSADQTSRPASAVAPSQETLANRDEVDVCVAEVAAAKLQGSLEKTSSLVTKSDVQLDVDSDEKKKPAAGAAADDSDNEFALTPREAQRHSHKRRKPKPKGIPLKHAWGDATDESEYSPSPPDDGKPQHHSRKLLDPRGASSISDESINKSRHQTAKKFSRYAGTSPRSRRRAESAFSQDNYQQIMEAYQPTEVRTNSAATASYKPQMIHPTSQRMVKLWENNMWWKFKFKDDKSPNN
ncbi:PREDICTED: uncharacterized protein LOC106820827 [Priapulus caudatus]|uniref:Uncharacterized protein LOC106820827 n=1 Tax=Priapulus caudatus TaxID=37621 RepID=A0ABM1F8W3_PRICU|nr:PREDICTED: uncharacterized protein LOC106820827 [Priapulus caudatus]